MPGYRLYFTDGRGSIQARDEFICADDPTALSIAEHLLDACSEVYTGFELWCGAHRVVPANGSARRNRPDADEIRRAVQEIVVDREHVLLDSGWAVAQSRKLLQARDELAGVLGKAAGKR